MTHAAGIGAVGGMTAAAMRARASEVTDLLRILANPNRLMILCILVEGEFSVGQIEDRLDLHQPTLSQQLTVLRKAGFVDTRREAKQVFYRLAEPKAAALIGALHAVFCGEDECQ